MVTLKTKKGEKKVCLSAPGNTQVLKEAAKKHLRKPADYTDEEIERGIRHHFPRHREHDMPKKKKKKKTKGRTLATAKGY